MSQNFDNKGYENYFKALEQQLNKYKAQPTPHNEDVRNQKEMLTARVFIRL